MVTTGIFFSFRFVSESINELAKLQYMFLALSFKAFRSDEWTVVVNFSASAIWTAVFPRTPPDPRSVARSNKAPRGQDK